MSFWSAITGGNTSTTQETNQTQTQKQTQSSTAKQAGSSLTTTLDPGTISLLQGVIGNLGGNLGQGSPDAASLRSFIPLLLNNTDPKQVQSGIDAATQGAIRGYNIGEGAQISQVQQQIGSKNNSFSQLLQQQGGIDLASTIGQITTGAQTAARSQRSTDIGNAISGEQAASQASVTPLTSFLDSIRTLSGAQTQQTTQQSSQQDVLSNLLATLLSQTKTNTNTSKGLLPALGDISNIFSNMGSA